MVIASPKSISDQIYEYFKVRILYCEIEPGERLAQGLPSGLPDLCDSPGRKARLSTRRFHSL